ncbi:MAG: ABC transporter permease subunit [Lachnospiraceae bacterium]|nr:ABC transporter permease subunit [Lachnospiraceae bacterium]
MYNLIKMELYRLCHATSTWVILAVAVAGVAALMALTGALVSFAGETEDGTEVLAAEVEENVSNEDASGEDASGENLSGEDLSWDDASENNSSGNGVTAEIYMNAEDDWNSEEADLAETLASVLQGGLFSILCVILAATYAYADQKNGYLKNIAGQYPSREKLVLAKCAATAVAVLVFLAACVATVTIGAKIIWGSSLHIGSFGELMKLIGIYYLLLVAFSLVTLMVTILARSSTAGVIVGILVNANMLSVIYTMINLLVEKVLPNANFDSSLYTIEYCLGSYGAGASSGDTAKAVAVALIYGALAAAVAAWVMKKRDVV